MTAIACAFIAGLLIGGIFGWLWIKNRLAAASSQLAVAQAGNQALQEKLSLQKTTMEELNRKFNTEFENIANRIMDTKTEKFTQLNKANLEALLGPLGKNITEFREQVNKVYQDIQRSGSLSAKR